MKTIALISSLDTKEEEILYAKELIEKRGLFTFLIDLSTRRLENAHADLKAKEILGAAGIGEEQIRAMDKADCISAMENAAKTAVQTAYADGWFQGILCIGGGQNARMAAHIGEKNDRTVYRGERYYSQAFRGRFLRAELDQQEGDLSMCAGCGWDGSASL